ncbi:FG-GAP-like repeat-containing protein [Streptomyces sp. NPDC012769]|uniref:FG-GAP-like repeat-containing protein n=1 Tax=Streptomyces sp. NPDC012769 TaxID=3364848 RepID=UPI0036849444
MAYKPYPNSSFYNGTNFSSGTSDARVGSENETGGTARSFWRMGFSSSLKGATISAATFKVLNNHSWSCTTREFQFWLTGPISSGTTWNAQPSSQTELQRKSFAHGWSSTSCPDEYEAFNVKVAAQKPATGGWSNITLGMRATSEGDTQTWRKFQATSAVLEVTFNRPPGTPTAVSSTPGGTCSVGTGEGVKVGKTNIILSATGSDPDGNLKSLRFRFWKAGTAVPAETLVTPASGGKATLTIPSTFPLEDKATYAWEVRAEDHSGAYSAVYPGGGNTCRLTIDAVSPPQPVVTSEVFKQATDDGATWATVKFGGTGAITFTSQGATKFRYGFDGTFVSPDPAANSDGTLTLSALKPPHAGPNVLQVFALDNVGNISARTDYTFYMQPRDTADAPGDVNGDGIPDLLTINTKGNLLTCPGGPNGELQACVPGSYTTDKTLNPPGYCYNATTSKPVPITHFNDTYPGDGMNDLLAVSPDGGLYIYPGDGYGTFNVDQRIDIEMPANAPAPSTFDQIVAVGDATGDGRPDVLATTQDGSLWAFTGYSGATFDQATRLIYGSWSDRDIFIANDISGDGVLDLIFRNNTAGELRRREGKPNTSGTGTDLLSLASAAAPATPTDPVYSLASGWQPTEIPLFMAAPDTGNPEAGGDGIPDFWCMYKTGAVRFVRGGRTSHVASYSTVIWTDGLWTDKIAFG